MNYLSGYHLKHHQNLGLSSKYIHLFLLNSLNTNQMYYPNYILNNRIMYLHFHQMNILFSNQVCYLTNTKKIN